MRTVSEAEWGALDPADSELLFTVSCETEPPTVSVSVRIEAMAAARSSTCSCIDALRTTRRSFDALPVVAGALALLRAVGADGAGAGVGATGPPESAFVVPPPEPNGDPLEHPVDVTSASASRSRKQALSETSRVLMVPPQDVGADLADLLDTGASNSLEARHDELDSLVLGPATICIDGIGH